MGFSSEWVSIMKGTAEPAFTSKLNAPNVRGVFIDGQIQMMKSSYVTTMDMFYKVQFANVIDRYLKNGHSDLVVILAFDDYNHVPLAKNMTQVKRKQKVTEVLPFTETDDIPTGLCPANWAGAMCNRVFKTKLIKHISEVIGTMVTMKLNQRVIVDFMGDPIEYSLKRGGTIVVGSSDKPCFVRTFKSMERIGEADCKFPRWADYIAGLHPDYAIDFVVEATDSDYLLIAMLHYERQCRHLERDANGLARIIIRRIRTAGKQHAAGERARAKKRIRDSFGELAPVQPTRGTPAVAAAGGSAASVEAAGGGGDHHQKGGGLIRSLVAIVALGGNDFCRCTPRLGPHRMWELLPLILGRGGLNTKLNLFPAPIKALQGKGLEPAWGLIDFPTMADTLVSAIYAELYSKHVKNKWDGTTFQSLCAAIKNPECKLSEGVKQEFPSCEQMRTTVGNASWNLLYWLAAAEGNMSLCPDPIAVEYGYGVDSKGKAQWLDLLGGPSTGA